MILIQHMGLLNYQFIFRRFFLNDLKTIEKRLVFKNFSPQFETSILIKE